MRGGVWHCGVDAVNPYLGTTGVQTLLDALPAATMKFVNVGGMYGHITTPVSTHGYVAFFVCVTDGACCNMHVAWVG